VNQSDFIIEAASQEAVFLFAQTILEAGKDLLIMSVGALVDHDFRSNLERIARKNGVKIFLPTGAICAIDGLSSAAVSGIDEVSLISTKPPEAFKGVPYVEKLNIDLDELKESTILFEGTAAEAVKLFPKNVNVAATVSLAGIGFEKTKVTLIADPKTKQNHHRIMARGEFGTMEAAIDNLPFQKNPKTSRIAAQSAIAALRKIVGTYWVGV
jgi:aspartate dehydrogenase